MFWSYNLGGTRPWSSHVTFAVLETINNARTTLGEVGVNGACLICIGIRDTAKALLESVVVVELISSSCELKMFLKSKIVC